MKITIASVLFLALVNAGCSPATMILVGNCMHASNSGTVNEGGNGNHDTSGGGDSSCHVTTQTYVISFPVRQATLKNAAGEVVGTAILAERAEGLVIAADLHGLPSGNYSISFHSVANCDLVLPSNRTRQLPIEINTDKGFGTTIQDATLSGPNGVLGTDGGTIVINDNAGTRVACGVTK